VLGAFGRCASQKPNHRHRRLLRACRKRPRRRPTEKRNKLPPSNHEEFSSRVGLPSYFGLETSILARGRAGSNRAVLTTAGWSAHGRFCCKSLFALVIKISFGCTREFRVKMWGTSSPEDKLAGDRGNVVEATSTGSRRSDFFTAEILASGNLGLLQQYRHEAAEERRAENVRSARVLCSRLAGSHRRLAGSDL
jgi:hypothetical protein